MKFFGKGKKKKKANPANRVFTDRPRKVFRHYIGRSEVGFGVFFIVFTAVMGAWFFLQKNNYNPDDRDISMEVLMAQQVEDHLWEPPLQRWVEPGSHAAVAGGAAPVEDLGIYPASTVSDGWATSGRVEEFDWDTLANKINGQETQYKEFGFKRLHFVGLENPADSLAVNVELYELDSFPNALGIFAAQRSAKSKVEQRGNAYLYLTEVGALGIVDKYYFKFTGDTPSTKIQDHALKVIEDFAAKQQASGGASPTGFMMFLSMGIDFGDIEYVPNDVFKYGFAKDFWFAKTQPGGTATYFIHHAASPEAAAELLAKIIEEHQWDYTVVSKENGRTVFQHNYVKNYFVIEQRDDIVYGVDRVPDPVEAGRSIDTLAEKLFAPGAPRGVVQAVPIEAPSDAGEYGEG